MCKFLSYSCCRERSTFRLYRFFICKCNRFFKLRISSFSSISTMNPSCHRSKLRHIVVAILVRETNFKTSIKIVNSNRNLVFSFCCRVISCFPRLITICKTINVFISFIVVKVCFSMESNFLSCIFMESYNRETVNTNTNSSILSLRRGK